MASLNQIVFNIAEAAGEPNNTVLQERIKFMVEYYRALFIRRDSAQNFNVPDAMTTTRTYDMQWVNAVEGCNVSLPCKVLRTTDLVPAPLNMKNASGFLYVGAVDGQESYQYVTPEQLRYALSGKFTGNTPKYFYSGGYLYVANSSAMCIDVKMVAESPVTGGPQGGGGVTCISPDEEYPITMDMIQRVTQAIMGTELQLFRPDNDEQIDLK